MKKVRKVYCPKCGTQCVVVRKHYNFDDATGKEKFTYHATCPKAGFFDRWIFKELRNGHSADRWASEEEYEENR